MKSFVSHVITVLVTSAVWFTLNAEQSAFQQSQSDKEKQRLIDSLAKCNGLIKINQFKYPSEK